MHVSHHFTNLTSTEITKILKISYSKLQKEFYSPKRRRPFRTIIKLTSEKIYFVYAISHFSRFLKSLKIYISIFDQDMNVYIPDHIYVHSHFEMYNPIYFWNGLRNFHVCTGIFTLSMKKFICKIPLFQFLTFCDF